MISPKKLIKMARKWHKMAALSRKTISFPITNKQLADSEHETCTTTSSSAIEKGHFVIYTRDQKRFVMPLAYLKHNILRELLKLSEEEFGISSNGPITLPCDGVLMEYVITLIRRGVVKDLEKALLKSIETTRCSVSASSLNQGLITQSFFVSVY
ncbi:hypothetical protein UlMin_032165 [Ulmus minor]